MAMQLPCQSCYKLLQVPDDVLGKQIQCPLCGARFIASAGPSRAAQMPYAAPQTDSALRDEYEQARSHAASRMLPPAVCLMVVASLGILLGIVGVVMAFGPPPADDPNLPPFIQQAMRDFHGPMAAVFQLGFLVLSGVCLVGSIQMLRLRMYPLALVTSVLAMVNIGNCCCILGLPFGIWALVVLSNSDVKSAFLK